MINEHKKQAKIISGQPNVPQTILTHCLIQFIEIFKKSTMKAMFPASFAILEHFRTNRSGNGFIVLHFRTNRSENATL